MMVFTRNRHDAAATSAHDAAGKPGPSVASEVPTIEGPTLLTIYIYIYIHIYI